MRAGASCAATVLALWSLGAGAPAFAEHARLEAAARLVEEADFEQALAALGEVAASEGLTRADLLRLLALEALVYHALGDEREIENTLTQLASLEPDHRFGEAVPPALQQQLDRVRAAAEGPLTLALEARRIRGGFQIEGQLANDRGRLVRQTIIFARLPGGEWVRTEGRRASIPVRGDGAVEYYAQALGPGGAVVLEEGSEQAPRLIGTPQSEQPSSARLEGAIGDAAQGGEGGEGGEGAGEGGETRRRSPWVWVGLSAGALAVVGGVLAAVLLTRDAQNTQLGTPEIDWP